MGVNLVAHPGDDFGLGGQDRHLAGFPDVVGQGFLAVNMDTPPHGIH